MSPKTMSTYTYLADGDTFVGALIGIRRSLWMGRDHLLDVDDSLYSRTVSRVDFADIEAIVVQPTTAFRRNNLLCALPCLIGLGLAIGGSSSLVIPGIAIMAPFLLCLVINIIRGTTCDCRLQTGIHTRRLLTLSRRADLERVLPLLVTRIREAQAGLQEVDPSVMAPAAAAGETS